MSSMINTLYGPVPHPIFTKAQHIKLLICDVDGVFSDGRIYMGNQGEELKAFHTRDGYGIKCILAAGIEVAVITGRKSQIVEKRMKALGIKHIYQGSSDKLADFYSLLNKVNLTSDESAYLGDDLIDWPVMEKVALSVCVHDGHPLLAKRADWITQTRGGFGAVREICDLLLESRSELDKYQGQSI